MKKLILLSLFVVSFCFVNAQIEQNDSIKAKSENREFIEPYYNQQSEPDIWEISKTPGDYIIKSSELKLLSIEIGIITTALYKVGVFNNVSLKGQKTIFYSTGGICLGLFIAGELILIKAGKLMNEERVSLSPASEGIGLAINF
jgi:hypothetical protein